MDDFDLDDLQSTKYVTDTDTDQDSLDERIDSEQRLRNHQLWVSFQTAASCITKLYKDKTQPNLSSPWVSFQNAASNLATLYKDCIDSQRKFARIGYQAGRRRKTRELTKLLKKHKIPTKVLQTTPADNNTREHNNSNSNLDSIVGDESTTLGQQHLQQSTRATNNATTTTTTNVTSILSVNQLNLDCDETPSSNSMQAAQPSSNNQFHLQSSNQIINNQQQQQQSNLQILLGNNEDDLYTFQQALTQPIINNRVNNNNKTSQHRRPCSNSSGYLNNSRSINDTKTEEERLLELNQFLSEEYHRHVGSRKRSCSNLGGDSIKRHRE